MATKESDPGWDAFHRSDAGGDNAAPDVDAVHRLVGELYAKILRLEARVVALELEGKGITATKRIEAVDDDAEEDFFKEASAPEAECIKEEASETDEKFEGASAPEAEAIEEDLVNKCEDDAAAESEDIDEETDNKKCEENVTAVAEVINEEADNKKCGEDVAAETEQLSSNVNTTSEGEVGSDETAAAEAEQQLEHFSDMKLEVDARNNTDGNENSPGVEAQEETGSVDHRNVRHLLFLDSTHQFLFIDELDLGECGVFKVLPYDRFGSVVIIVLQLVSYCMLGFLIFNQTEGRGGDALEIGQEYVYDESENAAEISLSQFFSGIEFVVGSFAIIVLCFILQSDLIGVFLLITCPGWKAKLAGIIIALEAAVALVIGFIALTLISEIGNLDAFLLCVGIIFIHNIDDDAGPGIILLNSVCQLRGSRRIMWHFWRFYFAFVSTLSIIGIFGIMIPWLQIDL